VEHGRASPDSGNRTAEPSKLRQRRHRPAAVTTTGNLTKSQKIQKSLKSNPKLFFNPLEHKFKPQNMRSNKNQENFNKPKRFIFILLKSLF
jgi:hypothetical protein